MLIPLNCVAKVIGYFEISNIFVEKIFKMSKIVGLGNALVDLLVTLKDDNALIQVGLPKGSMQLISQSKFQEINKLFSTVERHLTTGGSAANTIQALARLNSQVGFIGKVGNDNYGNFFQTSFSTIGVSTQLLTHTKSLSGVASTFITPDGERTFGTYLGAAAQLNASDLDESMFSGYDILYIEGYLVQNHELIEEAVKLAKRQNLTICLDLASYNIVTENLDFFHYLVKEFIDIVFANEEEAYAFSSKNDPIEALNYISEFCSIAIVKIGSQGSFIKSKQETYQIEPLPKRNVIDTTGAGDYYAAGFLHGLSKNTTLAQAGEIGSLLSGYIIEVVGTTLSSKAWLEIESQIQQIIKVKLKPNKITTL